MIDNKTIRKVIMLNKMLPSGSPTYENREASGAVANFTTNVVMPFVKCECEILPIQEGTGTPSSSNPRPISGTDELMLTHTNYRTAETYTFDLGQEIMGGTADVVGGSGEKTHGKVDFSDLNWVLSGSGTSARWRSTDIQSLIKKPSSISEILDMTMEQYLPINYGATLANYPDYMSVLNTGELITYAYDTVNKPKGACVFPLATSTDFTFTGQPINSYLGVNNVWTKAGDTKVTYKYKTGEGGSSNKKYLPIFYNFIERRKFHDHS